MIEVGRNVRNVLTMLFPSQVSGGDELLTPSPLYLRLYSCPSALAIRSPIHRMPGNGCSLNAATDAQVLHNRSLQVQAECQSAGES